MRGSRRTSASSSRFLETLEHRLLLSASDIGGSWFEWIEPSNSFKYAAAAAQVGEWGPLRDGLPSIAEPSRWIVEVADDERTSTTDTSVQSALWQGPSDLQALFASHKLQVERGLGKSGLVSVLSYAPDEEVVAALSQNSSIDRFEASTEFEGQVTPSDPLYGSLAGIQQTNVDTAWESFGGTDIGSYDVVVGVLDTGIDLSHRDLYLNIWINQGEIPTRLANQLVDVDEDGLITFFDLNDIENEDFVRDHNGTGYIDAIDLLSDADWENRFDEDKNGLIDDLVGWDFLNNDNDPSDDHRHGHGTHVAGTIGAIGNNDQDIAGINWQTSLMPLKTLDENNRGVSQEAIAAINYMSTMQKNNDVNVRVANSSFAGTSFSPLLQDSIGEADILLVAAAGNGDIFGDGENVDEKPRFPAAYDLDNIISVTASNGAGTALASFSNFGSCNAVDDDGQIKCSVDVAAPGVGVISTIPPGTVPSDTTTVYTSSRNGTSMAAPHVTGIAALMFAHEPGASVQEVRDAIIANAQVKQKLIGLVASGGIVDAQQTLEALQETPSAFLVQASSIEAAINQPAFITVQYGFEDDEDPIDITTLGDDDLVVHREGFPNQTLHAEFVDFCWVKDRTCTSDSGKKTTAIQATYRVPPPNQYADLGFPAGWNAIDKGTYQVSAESGGVRNTTGIGNRKTQLHSRFEDFTFEVNIDDPSVIFVNTNEDAPFSDIFRGKVSLRTAVRFANQIGDDATIVLPPNEYLLTQVDEMEDESGGDLDIHSNITIIGAGSTETTIDAIQLDRVLDVHGGSRLRLTGVTLTGGDARKGGAIQNDGGEVHVTDSQIVSNVAFSEGGGIWNNGVLTVARTTIDLNEVSSPLGFGGGGIYNTGDLHLSDSTVSNNRVSGGFLNNGGGGGLYLSSFPDQSVRVVNTTISGNQATSGNGGGVNQLFGAAEFLHTTVTNNFAAGSGGGIAVSLTSSATMNIANSIIAGNTASSQQDISGPIHVDIEHAANIQDVDPLLGPLADNGGPTLTHILLPDSPAINLTRAIATDLAFDQRGLPRSTTDLVSAGAIEKHFAEIRGHLFHDLDGDGERNVREQALDEWIVYVDVNNDGSLNPGEPNTTTRLDNPATPQIDESQFVINDLDPALGDVAIRTVSKNGFVDSTPLVVDSNRSRQANASYDPFKAVVSPTSTQQPVFHLDFSMPANQLVDLTPSRIPLAVGTSVSTVAGAGPRLENGRQLDVGRWSGATDRSNAIVLPDHPILDEVSRDAGSIVTWIRVEDESEWNGIMVTTCDADVPNQASCDQFSRTRGLEFQTNPLSGVFGSVQGWNTNNFGPQHSTNGGDGGTETPTDEWTHVALTWNDAGDHTIFVNGVKGRTIEGVGTDPFGLNDPKDWLIGASNLPVNQRDFGLDTNARNLRGDLADFAIFDAELDGQAINDIIRNGVPLQVNKVFHLDFSDSEIIRDVSASKLTIEIGESVELAPNEGPRLASGRQLDAAKWLGTADNTNQILIFDNPTLDSVSQSAGSVTTWLQVDDQEEWNSILFTACSGEPSFDCGEFGVNRGLELSTNATSGVFGSVQGWSTNTFGPNHRSNGGVGGPEAPAGVWTHVAMTWNDAGDHTVYVNGVQGATFKGVGKDPFGSNEPNTWTIGGEETRLNSDHPPDANGRRLRGMLADFAIFDGELDRQTINDIMRFGVSANDGIRPGVQSLAGFGRTPSIVGNRIVFEDHLGRVQLKEGSENIVPLVGLNTVSTGPQPFADGQSISYDGELVAFSGLLGTLTRDEETSRTSSIFVVNQFGAFEELINESTVVPGADSFEGKNLEVHSITEASVDSVALVAFGVREPDSLDQETGRILQRGVNRSGLFAATASGVSETPAETAILADRTTVVPGTTSTFQTFGELQLDETTYAFQGTYDRGFGIYERRGATPLRTVVNQDTSIPGGTTLRSIGGFAFSEGQVAFHGIGDSQEGIYLSSEGSVQVLADRSVGIPDDVGRFTSFGEVAFNKGNAVFVGRGRPALLAKKTGQHEQLGIYVSLGGRLEKVVDLQPDNQPNAFGGRQPVQLSIGPEAISGNRVVFYAAFADGTDGIFTATFESQSKHEITLEPGLVIESLDFGRQPLPGRIQGQSFNDINRNGVRDEADEPGRGWTVYLDQNNNGILDPREPSTNTGETGEYEFTELPALREYVVRQVPKLNWVDSAAFGSSYEVFLDANETESGLDFANRRTAEVAGQGGNGVIMVSVFNDLNNNGVQDPNEQLRPDREVYVDVNNNGVYDEDTDRIGILTEGKYRFEGLPIISHEVRLRRTDGLQQTAPLGNTFDAVQRENIGDRPTAIVAGRFDGDDELDFIVGNNSSNTLSFLSNATRVPSPGASTIDHRGNGPVSIAVEDFNFDGKLDLAVANFHSSDVSILLGNGDGTFSTPRIYPTGEQAGPVNIASIDANDDGLPDLVVSNSISDRLTLLTNRGNGVFKTTSIPGNLGDRPQGIATGHFNGDGLEDIVVVLQNPTHSEGSVRLLTSNGDGTFAIGDPESVGQFPGVIVAADFDGDGREDVAVGNLGSTSISVLFGNGRGSFNRQQNIRLDAAPVALSQADIDGDQDIDLIFTRAGDLPVALLRNDGNGVFRSDAFAGAADFPSSALPFSVASTDVSGDDVVDLVLANRDSDSITILENRIIAGSHRVALETNQTEQEISFGVYLLPGDANLDGQVTFVDFLALATNFGKAGDWEQGDFTGDGMVTFTDFIVLASNYGRT